MTENSPTENKYQRIQIVSIMFGFFVIGSIEMVGIASNYIKVGLHLSDAKANILPSLVYIWFILITIPAGLLMHKIGRERTVFASLALMTLSLLIPFFRDSYVWMLICFGLLGMSNVSLQTSLYPLLSNIVSGKQLATTLSFGQAIKTLSSFSAPYVAMIGSLYLTQVTGIGWRVLFLFYFAINLITITMLSLSKFEMRPDTEKMATYPEAFRLLKDRFVLLAFIGVMCHVGIDIGTNTLVPKLLMGRLHISIEHASIGSSLYFLARLAGCLFWVIFLRRVATRSFFFLSIGMICVAICGLFFADTKELIYGCILLIGFGNANLFPVLFSQAVLNVPQNKDTISVLMIMGQAGGALFPFSMGLMYDHFGMTSSISILLLGAFYLIFYCFRVKA